MSRIRIALQALWIPLFLMCVAGAHASDALSDRGREFMTKFGERFLAAYADKDSAELRERVARVLLDSIDFNALSGAILDYSGLQLSERERLGFLRKITVYVIDELLSEIGGTGVKGYEIKSVEAGGDGTWSVATEIVAGDDDVLDATWLLRERNRTLRVADIEVDGFSLVRYFGTELDRVARGNEGRLRRVLNGENEDDADLKAIVRKRVAKRRRG